MKGVRGNGDMLGDRIEIEARALRKGRRAG